MERDEDLRGQLERLQSALAAAEAELDELKVQSFRLERENLRLRISLQLIHDTDNSADALEQLAVLNENEPKSISLEG